MAQENKPEDSEKQPETTYTAEAYAALQEQLKAVQKQLKDANTAIQSYKDMDIDGIQKAATEWQQKYEQAEAERAAQSYRSSVSEFVRKQHLKNDIYSDYLIHQILEKKLQFDENGTLLGGEEMVRALKESCPDAFAPDTGERAAAPTSGSAPQGMSGVEAAFYAMNPNLKKS